MTARRKHYRMRFVCPQCGSSELPTLTREEILNKYPGVENVDLDCGACLLKIERETTCAR